MAVHVIKFRVMSLKISIIFYQHLKYHSLLVLAQTVAEEESVFVLEV